MIWPFLVAFTVMTDANGDYKAPLPTPAVYTITPTKKGDVNGAVTALDSAVILQYLVGLYPLTPEQLVICDVSGNGAISAFDAALIQQFLVGLIDGLPAVGVCGSDWIFFPRPGVVVPGMTTTDPSFVNGCTMGNITVDSEQLLNDLTGQDYIGAVIGDCTGNWRPLK